jgi:hypothetical protein
LLRATRTTTPNGKTPTVAVDGYENIDAPRGSPQEIAVLLARR